MLTAANAIISLSQATLFPTPQQLQGFAADDVTDMEQAKILDHVMGVDGILSFGFVQVERMQNITLQGDSVSNGFFDTIMLQQLAAETAYPLSGVIILPAINLMFNCVNGALETYNPMPQVRRLIQPRRYRLVWNKVLPRPTT
jgi:hypothetical protein